jgi:uracil-DNA glycosylase
MSDAVRHAVAELAGDLRAWLEYAQDTGAEFLPWEPPQPRRAAPPASAQHHTQSRPPEQRQQPQAPNARPPQTRPPTRPPESRPKTQPGSGPSGRGASQGAALDAVRAGLGECTWCGLHHGRDNIVFGVGNPRAEVVIVGEAPGRDEQLTGEPFVGRAGQLLTRMLQAIGLQREDAYLCNLLKCPPPSDRAPSSEEIAALVDVLTRQIEAISPKVIVTSGQFASQSVLGLATPMDTMRGTVHSFKGIPVVPMTHPTDLLRDASGKRQAYQDLLVVKSLIKQP